LVPYYRNLYFFNEVDLFQGEKSHQNAAQIRRQHFQEMEQYELFLQRKGRRPLYDLYACFQPFNEATKAFFPFIKSLRKRLKPGDVILNLWDRSAYFAGLLAAFFPDQQIITTWTGNKDVLGYKGFFHWLKDEPNLKVLFCDLDKPLPIQDKAISLVVGLDAFHRFDQSLLMRELLRITHDEAAIIFPHVHLSNSEPEPFFERGCKQIHGSDYDAFFQKMSQHHPRKGYVFGEPYLFWQNDGERNQQIPLRSNPHTTDYNALICILPNSWEEDISAFSMEDIEDIGSCRILLNQLLNIDLHQQRVRIDRSKMDGTAGHLLDRHSIFVKRMAAADGYILSEDLVQVLHLAQYGFTIDEISQQLGFSLSELSSVLKPLEQTGIVQVLPLSENFFRLQHFISTQYYIIPQSEQTIASLWQKAQGWFADQSLILDASDESEFSFEEADEVVQMICDRLQAGGIRKGDHVLLYGGLHVEALLTFWACMQLGIVVVPVHEHVNLPSLTAIQAEVQAKLIFCVGTHIEMVQQVAGNAEIVLWDDEDGELELSYFSDWLEEEGAGRGEVESIDHTDIAVVIFTSGSTGKPKGVPLSQGHLYRSGRLITETFHWTEKDRFLALGGLGYMSGLRNSCIAPLLSGTTVVVPDNSASQHAFGIAEAIDLHRVSILAANPALYRQFVQYKDRLGRQLRSLTCVMCTGSHLTEVLIAEFESAFQQKILNYYGLTETTGICTAVGPFAAEVPAQSIGQPIGSVAQVVDELGEAVPVGTEGELRIFSENLMTGYLNQAAETEKMMLNGWLYTGDIACMDDRNHIQLRGRKREIVKTATEELIYLNEIEAAARKLPWVNAAAALLFVKHDAERVALFILCEEDRIAEAGTILIREHLESLLGTSRLPQLIRLTSELPYGANGKILKKQLIHELQDS
jgi:acyl-coenzyme A synthetase/AMP-(fatty) acid ligase